MKKYFITIPGLFFCMISACGKPVVPGTQDPEGIEAAVQAFYASEYDYEETHTFGSDGEESGIVYEGQVTLEPYHEHVTVRTFGDTTASYSEVTYEEKDGTVSAELVLADGGTASQTVQRKYPYGYGESITFTEQEDGVADSMEVLIWHGEYVTDVGKAYGFKEELTAVVSQTYYVSKDDHMLIRVDTDLTGLNQTIAIANAMSGGLSYEEAKETVTAEAQRELVEMRIRNARSR